jgi:tetratricopeptide (TPR) repeat protein
MRKTVISAFLLLMSASVSGYAETQDVSGILKTTSTLIREKKYEDAQKLILDGLKKQKDSHKLWLALGYVFEADGQYEKALKAFNAARDLKTGIEGLSERITRLENLLKSTPVSGKTDAKALSLLNQARYQTELKNTHRGLTLFADAVLIDRSILGMESRLVELGLAYYKDPATRLTDEERFYFHGMFAFFAGNYDEAETELKKFVSGFPKSDNSKIANGKLEEIALLKKQLQEMANTPSPQKNKPVPAKIANPELPQRRK